MATPIQNYLSLRDSIDSLAIDCGRDPKEIEILPVSKGQAQALIAEALTDARFPRGLGENYLGELSAKAKALPTAEWHYLGRLQSRKIPEVARIASYIHTVTRLKDLELLKEQPKVPKFFLQVNISNEDQKNGVEPAELPRLIEQLTELGLKDYFVGLMGMAATVEIVGTGEVMKQFGILRTLRDKHAPGLKLSMGMTGDFDLAVRAGSNLIRIGTAIFGGRQAE